jgi:hypothetical protein
MSEPEHHDEPPYQRRSFWELLYGNSRRWIYIGLLIAALLVLKATGYLD